MDELDQIIKFLEPCDLVNFASVSKNKTALIQKYLKKISQKYKKRFTNFKEAKSKFCVFT